VPLKYPEARPIDEIDHRAPFFEDLADVTNEKQRGIVCQRRGKGHLSSIDFVINELSSFGGC